PRRSRPHPLPKTCVYASNASLLHRVNRSSTLVKHEHGGSLCDAAGGSRVLCGNYPEPLTMPCYPNPRYLFSDPNLGQVARPCAARYDLRPFLSWMKRWVMRSFSSFASVGLCAGSEREA